ADQERAVRFATQRRPGVAGRVFVDLDGERFELSAQPATTGGPRLGERHALGAIRVAGEGTQFLQVCDGAAWIQGRGVSAHLDSGREGICETGSAGILPPGALPRRGSWAAPERGNSAADGGQPYPLRAR